MSFMKSLKLINSIIVIFELFLCGGSVIGFPIVFGHGNGDIYIFIALYLCVIIHILLTIRVHRAPAQRYLLMTIIFGLTTILFSLKATVWRGPEYPWANGKVFFRPEKP
jgi:hypothetical protein